MISQPIVNSQSPSRIFKIDVLEIVTPLMDMLKKDLLQKIRSPNNSGVASSTDNVVIHSNEVDTSQIENRLNKFYEESKKTTNELRQTQIKTQSDLDSLTAQVNRMGDQKPSSAASSSTNPQMDGTLKDITAQLQTLQKQVKEVQTSQGTHVSYTEFEKYSKRVVEIEHQQDLFSKQFLEINSNVSKMDEQIKKVSQSSGAGPQSTGNVDLSNYDFAETSTVETMIGEMHKKMTQELETSQKEFETKLKKLNGQLETTNKSLNDTNAEVDNVVKGILIVINYRTGRQFEHH